MDKRIIANFAPSWPSVVMGTGIVPIALLFSESLIPGLRYLGIAFFVLTVVLFVLVGGMTLLRVILAGQDFRHDLNHPVSGNFIPTLPISAMVLAIDCLQIGPRVMDAGLAHTLALILFVAGTIGIYVLGLAAAAIMFDSKEVKLGHATFGWYIPPVSQLIVPVVGLDLALHYAAGPLSPGLFFVSILSLGIGVMLFLFVGANIYHRYLYHELPGAKMAPTVMIGLAPTAILVIIMVKLSGIAATPTPPWSAPGFPETARLLALMGWGFSAWWFVLALILLVRHLRDAMVDFALSWWALSFPVGALAIATGALHKIHPLPVLPWISAALSLLLLAIWSFVVVGTVRIIADGSAFEKHV